MSGRPIRRHLSCGHGRPFGARVFRKRFKGHMVCHCVLVGDEDGLVLVDAGLSEAELEEPRRLGSFARGLGLKKDPSLAARRQVEALGLDPSSVRDIVLTHMDLDHAGGLRDFPEARVHVHARELEAARERSTLTERLRYRPEQWRDADLREHAPEAIETLDDAAPIVEVGGWSVSLVPLFGHTRGHCGVLLRSSDVEILHVGDAYYDASELEDDGSFLFRLFRDQVDHDAWAAKEARVTVARWKGERPAMVAVSSHDPSELAAAAESVSAPDRS